MLLNFCCGGGGCHGEWSHFPPPVFPVWLLPVCGTPLCPVTLLSSLIGSKMWSPSNFAILLYFTFKVGEISMWFQTQKVCSFHSFTLSLPQPHTALPRAPTQVSLCTRLLENRIKMQATSPTLHRCARFFFFIETVS